MPLDRISDHFERNTEQAQRSAKEQLRFILANEKHLLKLRGGEKKVEAARSFDRILQGGGSLTPGQLSYCDAIYESTWKGADYANVNSHHDKRKPGLRYPK